MSSSNCCFLTCIQISQEAGQVVWYSHHFQNFPQSVVIHTVKGFGIVIKAEIDIFLELSCFLNGPSDIGNLISGSSAFSKTNLNIRKFTVHVLLKPSVCLLYRNVCLVLWPIFFLIGSFILVELRCISCLCILYNNSLSLPFFGIGMKTDLFQSCGHC